MEYAPRFGLMPCFNNVRGTPVQDRNEQPDGSHSQEPSFEFIYCCQRRLDAIKKGVWYSPRPFMDRR